MEHLFDTAIMIELAAIATALICINDTLKNKS